MTERTEAIAAGLLVGKCEWCHEDIWKDGAETQRPVGNGRWHLCCAKDVRDLVTEALDEVQS